MSKSQSFTASLISDYGTEGYAVMTYTGADNMVVNSSTFSLASLFPTITCQINYTASGGASLVRGTSNSQLTFSPTVYNYYTTNVNEEEIAWSNHETKTLHSDGSLFSTLNTSSFFNSDNPTARSVPITYTLTGTRGYAGTNYYGAIGFSIPDMTLALGQTIVLDAPPSFSNTPLSKNTDDYYTGVTTVSTNISNLSAQYGGNITEVKLTIGEQSASRINDGLLEINLSSIGTFTPTITATDSRGQTTTKNLPAITIKQALPSTSFNLKRVTSAGVPYDEGTYAFIEATFTWNDGISTLSEPTVKSNGVTISPVWYTSNTLTTVVDWSDTSSFSSPVTLYGLVGTFNPNHSYVIGITPISSIISGVEISQTLVTAFFTIDFLAGGHGVAFGQPCTAEGFYCNMDTYLKSNTSLGINMAATSGTDYELKESFDTLGWDEDCIDLNNSAFKLKETLRWIIDTVWPVGCYLHTSQDSSHFNPNTDIGGTWELLGEGYTLISGSENGSYRAGTNYGSNTKSYTPVGTVGNHTLTIDQIPSHRHNQIHLDGNSGFPIGSGSGSSGGGNARNVGLSAAKYQFDIRTAYTGGNGAHSHGFTGTASDIDVMQASTAVYIWHRIA